MAAAKSERMKEDEENGKGETDIHPRIGRHNEAVHCSLIQQCLGVKGCRSLVVVSCPRSDGQLATAADVLVLL